MPRERKNPRQPELIDGVRAGFPRYAFNRPGNDVLELTCPACRNAFSVFESAMRAASSYVTRSCPYCFKTARLPESGSATDSR